MNQTARCSFLRLVRIDRSLEVDHVLVQTADVLQAPEGIGRVIRVMPKASLSKPQLHPKTKQVGIDRYFFHPDILSDELLRLRLLRPADRNLSARYPARCSGRHARYQSCDRSNACSGFVCSRVLSPTLLGYEFDTRKHGGRKRPRNEVQPDKALQGHPESLTCSVVRFLTPPDDCRLHWMVETCATRLDK